MVTLPPAKHRVLNLPERKGDCLELATAWLSWQSEQRSADVLGPLGMLQDCSLQGLGAAGRWRERKKTQYLFSPPCETRLESGMFTPTPRQGPY